MRLVLLLLFVPCSILWADDLTVSDLAQYLARTPLYQPAGNLPRERWAGGTLQTELALWEELGRQGLELQRAVAKKFEIEPDRIFHAKSHGCLVGKFKLAPGRPEWTRRGIYSSENFSADEAEEYDAIIRFSSGLGNPNASDQKADLRGMAVKLFIPAGFEDPITHTRKYFVDLTTVNTPWPMTANPSKFMEFAWVNVSPLKWVDVPGTRLGRPQIWAWAQANPDAVSRIYRGTIRNEVRPLTQERWWSQHAYLHGSGESARSVKFNFRPAHTDRFYSPLGESTLTGKMTGKVVEWVADTITLGLRGNDKENYLRNELGKKAASGIHFIYSLQRDVNAALTPLENTPYEWKETVTPSVSVAGLVVPPQALTDEKEQICETVMFSPGNFHPDHRPLEEMGRFRMFVYLLSHQARGGRALPESPKNIRKVFEMLRR